MKGIRKHLCVDMCYTKWRKKGKSTRKKSGEKQERNTKNKNEHEKRYIKELFCLKLLLAGVSFTSAVENEEHEARRGRRNKVASSADPFKQKCCLFNK